MYAPPPVSPPVAGKSLPLSLIHIWVRVVSKSIRATFASGNISFISSSIRSVPKPADLPLLWIYLSSSPFLPGVRRSGIDAVSYTHLYEIPVFYDPMIGKLIVWATTRQYAIERMRRVLYEYKICLLYTSASGSNAFTLEATCISCSWLKSQVVAARMSGRWR